MGGRRPRPCLQHLPRPDLGPRRPTGHPAKAHRCAGRLPALDLRQPALGREPLGATERGAGNRNPLRENRQVLPQRPILRRHLRLAQGLTGLSKTYEEIVSDPAEKGRWRYHEINWKARNVPINLEDLDWIDREYIKNQEEFPLVQFQVTKALGRIIGFW